MTAYLPWNNMLMNMIFRAFRAALVSAIVFLIVSLLPRSGASSGRPAIIYDLIIANGIVVDGTGQPGFKADLGLAGHRIAAVGRLDRGRARRIIDAQGLVVAPGFIDIHTHCDRGLLRLPQAENFIRQGVTTVIGGNCGSHPYPLREVFRAAEEQGITPNWGLYVGHNTIRERVMGSRPVRPTADEMQRMKSLVEEEMRSGALGFSTGLSYTPGVYAETEEVVELAGVAGRLGGLYATHLRDQGRRITEAIEEAVEVGRRNAMPVEISHIKLADERVWGDLDRVFKPLAEARRRGVAVTLDAYPYTAASMGFTNSFPRWSTEGGPLQFGARLEEPALYSRIRSSVIEARFHSTRGRDLLKAIIIEECGFYPHYAGLNVEQILANRGQRPTPEAAADLVIDLEKHGGASAMFFQMNEADVAALIRRPEVMIASDADLVVPGQGHPHPRSYGTFPRVLGRYVRDQRLLPLEEAVRKMTSFPARVLKLEGRGELRPGMWADLVIFDPVRFEDGATYGNPHQFNPGLADVLVNGEIVLDNGRLTGRKPGRVLRGPARQGSGS